MVDKVQKIWLDGEMTPWISYYSDRDDAKAKLMALSWAQMPTHVQLALVAHG